MNPIRRLPFIGLAASLALASALRAEAQQPTPQAEPAARLRRPRPLVADRRLPDGTAGGVRLSDRGLSGPGSPPGHERRSPGL